MTDIEKLEKRVRFLAVVAGLGLVAGATGTVLAVRASAPREKIVLEKGGNRMSLSPLGVLIEDTRTKTSAMLAVHELTGANLSLAVRDQTEVMLSARDDDEKSKEGLPSASLVMGENLLESHVALNAGPQHSDVEVGDSDHARLVHLIGGNDKIAASVNVTNGDAKVSLPQ